MKPNVMTERGSAPPGDENNDETFTIWGTEKKSRLVNGTRVTAREETLLSPLKHVPAEVKERISLLTRYQVLCHKVGSQTPTNTQ